MKAARAWMILTLIGWVGVVAYPASWSFAATANPSSSTGRSAAALATTPDPKAFNVELKPPLTRQSSSENHVFVAGGTLQAGAHETKSFVLPRLARVTALLVGEGVRYAFRSPRGETIVPGETKDRGGYQYSGMHQGLGGFTIEQPEQGMWTATIEATGSRGTTEYMIDVSSDGPAEETAHLETMLRDSDPRLNVLAKPGEPIFLRAFITRTGQPVPGVRWSIKALTPSDRPVIVPVYDDGRHADGRANDGVFVGAIVAEGPDGFYEVRATGSAPGGAEYTVTRNIEVEAENDLLIADTIAVSPASPKAGQPVTLTVTAMNEGTVDSQGVELEFYIGTTRISGQTFDLKAGESRRITTTWTPPVANDYEVQLSINPFLEPSGSNFGNNTQKKLVRVR